MRRRQVIALLALAASAGPLASRAQTGIKRVGVVYQGGPVRGEYRRAARGTEGDRA